MSNTESLSFKRGFAMNLFSVFLNAIAMTIAKSALTGVNPILTTLIISATSAVLSLSYLSFKGHSLSFKEFKNLFPIAILNALATISLYLSISILSPVMVGILGRFYVVFTSLLSILILREKVSKHEIGLILVVIIGTFLFVNKGSDSSQIHYLGVILGIGYTFLFALANLFVKKSIQQTSSATILFYNNIFTAIACMLVLEGQHISLSLIKQTSLSVFGLAVLTAFITFFGLVLFFDGFRFLSFKLSNLIRSSSPLFVTAVSWPFYPINLNIGNIIGGFLVVGSIIFLSIMEKRK